MATERLNVIALISGGKDSFFSLLHCIHHGHRVVALANLFPDQDSVHDDGDAELQVIEPGYPPPEVAAAPTEADEEGDGDGGAAPTPAPAPAPTTDLTDLNSFMYQTVGHEVIPLYAAATGLPLYRLPIRGSAIRHERDYDFSSVGVAVGGTSSGSGSSGTADETETMTSLLSAIMHRHPEANAVSAGAILSTYQRTRVESVALRLGLAPLAFLWKYPVLPRQDDGSAASAPAAAAADDAQLLRDMGTAGLEARVIKVASAGLGDDFLWTPVTEPEGIARIQRALRKFGTSYGAVLGEGGEFETLVVDGPQRLFRQRINPASASKTVVREGGGTAWLLLRGAQVVSKDEEREPEDAPHGLVPTPVLLDAHFQAILSDLALSQPAGKDNESTASILTTAKLLGKSPSWPGRGQALSHWVVKSDGTSSVDSIESETTCLVSRVRHLLAQSSLDPDRILNTVIILRRMSDFPKVNAAYGKLFSRPNPPSRVTISCGDLLPDGCDIIIALTVDSSMTQSVPSRHGLHVQSRSYWAPANIGPYSQAIGAPALPQAGTAELRAWSIAGQIPLIPATMVLPSPSDSSLRTQIVLSLQHLWRIAVDVRIQFWTSAVAFFGRVPSAQDMEQRTDLAGRAWRLAHKLPANEDGDDGDGDADNGPDLWDLKYNPEYAGLSSANDREPGLDSLPDWSVLPLRQQNEAGACIPPFFAVEVEELPRGSDVEWHAHLGLSHVDEGSVEVVGSQLDVGAAGLPWTAWHTIARTGDAALLHTVLALPLNTEGGDAEDGNVLAARLESVRRLNVPIDSQDADAPYLAYVDAVRTKYRDGDLRQSAVIPCRSMHSPGGRRWAIICLYRTVLQI